MNTYYTKTEYDAARSENLAECLLAMGYELKREGNGYRGVVHDSFVIPNATKNEWHWNSKDLHGKEPINALSAILQYDYGYDKKDAFMTAIKRLAKTEGQNLPINTCYRPPVIIKPKAEARDTVFILPERNSDMKRCFAYLCQTRKLDPDIIKELARENKIYETKQWHNVCFVSYDKDHLPKHAFMRGTTNNADFKKDVDNSDKAYGFTLMGNKNTNKVCCFESSIDAISHASLFKMHGYDYKDVHRISLHGTSFLSLEQFLRDNPNVNTILSCLDNDETGNKRSDKLLKEYEDKGYKTIRQAPRGKDFNEMLVDMVMNKRDINNSIYQNNNGNQNEGVSIDD